MTITLIAAVCTNGVIGVDGDLAWRNAQDLRRFKKLTLGHQVVMGRRTFESIGRPLPGRRNIVLTRSGDWSADGVDVAHSLPEALGMAGAQDVFILGGGEIYRQSISLADRLEITHIEAEPAGDTHFPAIAPECWERTAVDHQNGFSWSTYGRRQATDASGRPAP
jgi:dihydrofolate reductase